MAAHVRRFAGDRKVEQIRFVELVLDLSRDALGLHRCQAGSVEVFEDDDELVAAHARDSVAFTDAVLQPASDFLQELIADVVAERVVKCLEVVEVDQHQGAVAVMPSTAGQRTPEPVEHQAPVGQARQ